MQSANLSGPLKGLRPYQALIGPTQASGLAGGFDCGKKYDKSSYFEKPGGLIYWGQQRRLGSDEAKKIVILE